MGDYQKIQESKIIRFRPVVAIAAAFILSLVGAGLWHHSNYKQNFQQFETFRSAMSYFASNPYVSLDLESQNLSELEQWLITQDLPNWSKHDLPPEILKEMPVGCAEILWRDLRISLTCFHNSDGDIIHLFTMEREPDTAKFIDDIDRLSRTHDLQSIGWMSEGQIFLLMGSEPRVEVSQYVGQKA